MSDDIFIREVNEELRQDRAKALWLRYGPIAAVVALVVIVATAAWVGWDRWSASRANASGDAFSQALKLAQDGKTDEALAALNELQQDSYGAYPVLARLRTGTLLASQGDTAGAVTAFDSVAADGAVPVAIRDMARLRAALVLVDSGSYADVSQRVESLTGDANALRHAAREALGLAAWKEGRAADAQRLFDQISADQAAPRNTRQRAEMMSELIRASGASS